MWQALRTKTETKRSFQEKDSLVRQALRTKTETIKKRTTPSVPIEHTVPIELNKSLFTEEVSLPDSYHCYALRASLQLKEAERF